MPSHIDLNTKAKALTQRIITESDARKDLAKKVPVISKKDARAIRASGNRARGDSN